MRGRKRQRQRHADKEINRGRDKEIRVGRRWGDTKGWDKREERN